MKIHGLALLDFGSAFVHVREVKTGIEGLVLVHHDRDLLAAGLQVQDIMVSVLGRLKDWLLLCLLQLIVEIPDSFLKGV